MIRVINPLIPDIKHLNNLYRNGFQTEVEQGLKILIRAIERGESIGDSAILQRLDQINAIVEKISSTVMNSSRTGKVDRPNAETLNEAELCQRFNISPNWRSFVPHGWVAEHWLSRKTETEYLGNDLYLL